MGKRGLPPNTAQSESFAEMCSLLEKSCESTLYSIPELRQRMVEEYGEDSVYSCKHLKRKLLEQYGEHIFFAEVSGRKDVVCLRDMAGYILSDKWYADRKSNTADESRRIIEVAASLLLAEIREQNNSTDVYPAADSMHDLNLLTEWMPPLLLLLMQRLVSNQVQQLSLGNASLGHAPPFHRCCLEWESLWNTPLALNGLSMSYLGLDFLCHMTRWCGLNSQCCRTKFLHKAVYLHILVPSLSGLRIM